jgi:hypothetical protein
MSKHVVALIVIPLILAMAAPAPAQSIFPRKPDDSGAVVLEGARGDGVADDTAALQAAVNRGRGGIVFIPEGRYRLTSTVYVPVGTRVFGFGANRPVFILGPNTPGFQQPGPGWPFGLGKYMIHFAESRQADGTVVDASELSFNSALANIDFEVGEGNPSAVCIRFHVAQRSYIAHANFKLGSALAALEDIGNASNDLRITGGKYGILTTRTSPNWQYMLFDSVFENQSAAGIRTQDVGFSLLRCRFANMPVAIEVPEDESEQIYGKDLRFENISAAAIKFGDARHLKHQVTLVNAACTDVPHFLANALEKLEAPGKFYVVDRLSAGLEIGPDGREVGIVTRSRVTPLQAAAPVVPSDIPPLPPMDQWFTVRPNTDLRAAVNEHRVLYFPMGTYRAEGVLQLRPDTVLIGLHCTRTTISSILTPRGGTNHITGVGVSGGAGQPNILWNAGEKSVLDDVAFSGGGFGRGGGGAAGGGAPPYIVVNNGGGGVFRNFWVEGGAPPTGLRVEDTSTPGKIYMLSNEHHSRVEVVFRNVRNWEVHCLQTEEESGQQAAYALEIENCRDLLFANTYMYRVSRITLPRTYAIEIRNSDNIVFDNVHNFSQTRLPFDNTVIEEGSGVIVRAANFTHLVVRTSMKKGDPLPLPAAIAPGAALERLATGFSNATSLTADDTGRIYFTDANARRIYRWNEAAKRAEVLAEVPGQNHPQVMGFVKPSTLLISTFAPGSRVPGPIGSLDINGGQLQQVSETATPRPGTALLLPVGLHNRMDIMQDYMNHRGYVFRQGSNTAAIRRVENAPRSYYYAPNSNVAIMTGVTSRPLMQASQMRVVEPGQNFYLTSEDDCRTWLARLENDLKLTHKLFAPRGGNAVVADSAGNVYIASDHVFVYDKDGKQVGIVEIPERPSGLAFGGADKKTLYIGARSSLYAIRTAAAGQ